MHHLHLQQGQWQRHQKRSAELHRIGCAHITRCHKTLLIQGSHGDAEQRAHSKRQIQPVGLSPLPELARYHQHQADKTQRQSSPLACGNFSAHGRQPHDRQHRLQAHNQRRQTRTHAGLHRRPDTPQVPRMHEDASHCQMRPLHSAGGPFDPRQHDPDQETCDREREAHKQKFHRGCVRHAVAGDDKTGTPDQHKQGWHSLDKGALVAHSHLTRARISGKAFCR